MQYFDISSYIGRAVFLFCYGGRGIGKTYSALRYIAENNIHFIYLRRTQKELDISCTREVHPFKPINKDFNRDFRVRSRKDMAIIEEGEEVKGYGAALSTFHNLRGADFSDADLILYDEFCAQPTAKPIKKEGQVFIDFYETVNRNREAEGKPPVRVLFLSNAVSMYSPILAEFGIIDRVEQLAMAGRKKCFIPEKSIEILLLDDAIEITREKHNSAIYKAVESDYKDFALSNNFVNDSRFNVKKEKLIEYMPLCAYDYMFFYRHKSRNLLYVTYSRADCEHFDKDTFHIFKRRHYARIREMIMECRTVYESYALKVAVQNLMGVGFPS